MGYPKKHRGRRKMGSKKEELEKEINENKYQLVKVVKSGKHKQN